jgi:hypothetical protein
MRLGGWGEWALPKIKLCCPTAVSVIEKISPLYKLLYQQRSVDSTVPVYHGVEYYRALLSFLVEYFCQTFLQIFLDLLFLFYECTDGL